VDSAWEIFAPAKLNLYLEVLGRRNDGFHELETLMAPIRFYDRLEWRPQDDRGSSRLSLRYHPTTAPKLQAAAPADPRNLVWLSVELLAQGAGVEPHGQFTLSKRIPVQAGLGGGSSDAAAALLLANAAWGLGYSCDRLSILAAELGSDVPFFLTGQSAICRGRGEQIEPIPHMPRLDVVVVVPTEGISTAAAFGALAAGPPDEFASRDSGRRLSMLLERLKSGSVATAGHWMANRLQSAAERICPLIHRVGTAFASASCCAHLLTGSGSAYFGVMRSARHARRAAAILSSANLGTVFASATCR
jgi:4-diphosphocytidyl-2-C-methyl-D-erythritol kinase